jgi:hypothetical protein
MAIATQPFVINDPRLAFHEDGHRYELDGRDLISVTTALREAGMVDDTYWKESARLRGQYVHSAIALYALDELDAATLDPELVPYFTGFLQFLADTHVVVEHSEMRLCDPVRGYAGTLDLIVRWPTDGRRHERRTLIDAKTGSFPPMTGPQTAAYLRCARYLYPAGTYIARAGLHLPGDGTYRLVEFNDIVQDENDFMGALRVAQFRRRHGIAT